MLISTVRSFFRATLKRILPASMFSILDVYQTSRPVARRKCPICGFYGDFAVAGIPPRIEAMCPECGSLERHRLFWLWLSECALPSPVLHFAPEATLSNRLKSLVEQYTTADLYGPADLKLDIENIQLNNSSFGCVICNHVLEHVDDRKALSELYRILVDGGQLIVTVPLVEGWDRTYEDESIVDPMLRKLHFGQSDHLRIYGADFRERLSGAGFKIEAEFFGSGKDVVSYGLIRGERIFVCRKTGVY